MLASSCIPAHSQILVIGGGPAGAYSAAALAREGFTVVLLEASKFPRYHIGESMLPSVRPYLKFIDAEEKLVKHGFTVKRGAAVKFNQFKREGYTDFAAAGEGNVSFNVVRSEFDDLLFRHAQECGVMAFDECKVTDVNFRQERPVGATYRNSTSQIGKITFDFLVDASGRNGIISTRYLKNREMNQSLKNIACWGYWTGTKPYMPGSNRDNAPWFEALTDESGWGWSIPLHDGTTSVGFVMDQESSIRKKAEAKASADAAPTLRHHYLKQMEYVPGIQNLLENAALVEKNNVSEVQSASDYSYSATSYAGDHFRLVGDASAFIDPFFSSGVHLALAGGLTAAISIAASIREQCTETEAAHYHDIKVGTAYTRFLFVVLSAYKQIRSQNEPVLSDINEDNFDRAFDMIRPIIQGSADVEKRVSKNEILETLSFVSHVLASPSTPEMQKAVAARISPELLSADGPILAEREINELAAGDEEARNVLLKLNARKSVKSMYDGPAELAHEDVDGLYGVVRRGSLGLAKSSVG